MAQENTASRLDPSAEGQDGDTQGESDQTATAAGTSAEGDGSSALHGAAMAAPVRSSPLGAAAVDGSQAPGAGADNPLGAGISDVAVLGNIPVKLSMEIGRTSITIAELLSLGKGSVVELQRMADEPLDILVNGTLVAHGEAVVVGERFGIRLTDVISAKERLGKVV